MLDLIKAEISGPALVHNLALLRKQLTPGTLLCAIVKANAYGHGIDIVLPVVAQHADWLGVATAAEALQVRELGYGGPLLMLFCAKSCAAGDSVLPELIRRDVVLSVTDDCDRACVADAARAAGAPGRVHLEVDTGMARSGVSAHEVTPLIRALQNAEGVLFEGIYTHFAVADEPDPSFTQRQLELFRQSLEICGEGGSLVRHCANSTATLGLPQTHFDMVRPGLAVYGYEPGDRAEGQDALRPALRLTSHLVQIRRAPTGTQVGYGLTYEFVRPGRIGLIPVGYGDGYVRGLSNHATVRVRGKDARVVGRVSMDQMTVDLTDVPDAALGDEVEVISPDRDALNSVENLARLADTIPYEIVARLGTGRIERVLRD